MTGDHLALGRNQDRHGPTELRHAGRDPGDLIRRVGLGVAGIGP